VRPVARLTGEWLRADGPGVAFTPVPHYHGAYQLMTAWPRVRRAIDEHARRPETAWVLRAPGVLADVAYRRLRQRGAPYGVEVVGDPEEAFAPGAVRHPLRAVLRWQLTQQLRRHCAGACAASYVNASVLPVRYPTSGSSIVASSIELRDDMIADAPRRFAGSRTRLAMVFVGSLEQYYKGPDVLLHALAKCVRRGVDLHLTMVGDGRHRGALERLADALGCRAHVQFVGQVAGGAAVRAYLDDADLFVLPSRSEGLPRAMIEAMARGLPCIGSGAGGIPELLPADAIVPAGDSDALAVKLREVVSNPARMEDMSVRNLTFVREYRSAVLQDRRRRFYRAIEAATAAWLQRDVAGTAPTARGQGV
jgi:glycosyltransferase involved in cell wall biosynthesis